MNYLIDLALIVLIFIFVFVGIKRGFVRMVLEFAAKILAFIAAAVLSGQFAGKMYEAFFKAGVIRSIETRLDDSSSVSISQEITASLKGIPSDLKGIADFIGIDESYISEKLSSLNDVSGKSAEIIAENVVSPIVTAICRIILFVLISFVLSIVFKFVIGIVSGFFQLPVLKTANKLLGGIAGFANAVLILWILSYILVIGSSFVGDERILKLVAESKLVSLFVNNKLLY